MKNIAIFALILGAACLGGCAEISALGNAWNVATSASVPTSSVVISANAFDALEATATNYLKLPKCSATSGVVCRDPAATAQIIPAVRAGRVARGNLEQFLTANPGQLGPTGLYNALQAAVTTLQGILTQYNIKS